MTIGVLLVNLGTPKAPTPRKVASYLRQFLMDAKVVDIPYFLRWVLVNLIIVPFRSKKSAKLYQKIWTEKGSPLLMHGQHLKEELAIALGEPYKVVLGMRYASPSIFEAVQKLKDCKKIILLPLFPQYADASTGSVIAETQRAIKKSNITAKLFIKKYFYNDPGFIESQATLISHEIQTTKTDYVLFSYHGLSVRQINKASACKSVCNRKSECVTISEVNRNCYRAQCFETTRALAEKLKLSKEKYSTAFQSRLGKTPWIEPYTDFVLDDLAKSGIKNIAVVCPSFVSDCLETLEEIHIRGRKQWWSLGGENFSVIPCVNSTDSWVAALGAMVREVDVS